MLNVHLLNPLKGLGFVRAANYIHQLVELKVPLLKKLQQQNKSCVSKLAALLGPFLALNMRVCVEHFSGLPFMRCTPRNTVLLSKLIALPSKIEIHKSWVFHFKRL